MTPERFRELANREPPHSNDLRQWQIDHDVDNRELAMMLGVNLRTVVRWRAGESAIPPYLTLALESLDT